MRDIFIWFILLPEGLWITAQLLEKYKQNYRLPFVGEYKLVPAEFIFVEVANLQMELAL
jgi:hypothetical protein